ncbi:MAG: YesL family protein [Lachnospiraceae bacterium]|nr:YesL family protein [Lachnospiraceae bacterium]
MKFLDYDSPLMQFLTKVANLMIINGLTLLCCLPIVTVGAALTAAHYMCMKMVRNEDGPIVKGYFKAFKESIRQATPVWFVLLLIILVLLGDYLIVFRSGITFPYWFQVALTAVAFIGLFLWIMVFPVMGKFENTTLRTLKNALIISIAKFPITLAMIVLNAIPIILMLLFIQILPLILMFGITVPAYIGALMLNKYFKKLEGHIIEAQIASGVIVPEPEVDDSEKIFHDIPEEKQ